MELTNEQIEAMIETKLAEMRQEITNTVNKSVAKSLQSLEIPDTRQLATKKFVTDNLESVRTAITDEISKTNTAVTKIASDTDTKITELVTKKTKFTDMFKTVIDYENEKV